jgi:hypoxanthine phosphoribosyltransferase
MNNAVILFSKKEIEKNIVRVATQINNYYIRKNSAKSPVIIPILNGGVYFYVDLARQLTINHEMGVISTSHYPNGKEVRELSLEFVKASIPGRNILLVDEICYTGSTLLYLRDLLLEQGAAEVKTVVLINQPKEHEHIIHIPDWAALEYHGKEWIAGYGMDFMGHHREEQNIFYLKQSNTRVPDPNSTWGKI